ncbi:fructokinase [Abditibacteriota bacterium]|nr:fructokinase [Abditibacteriota bacterium]
MAEVVCFGELLVDLVSEAKDVSLGDAGGFLKAPGGAPANVAAGLSRLDTPASFVGQVGNDPFGRWLRDVLRQERVDVSYLGQSPHARTTLAFVATRGDRRKDVCFYRNPGADAELSSADLDFAMFEGARLFHCGGVSLSQSPCREAQMVAARVAKERSLLVSFDPNWRPSLWGDHDEARWVLWEMVALSDIVKVADEEWEFFTGTTDLAEGATKIRAVGPQLVIVTLGAQGAYFNCVAGQGTVEGFPSQVVDTLGAGDSFMAGLLHQLVAQPTLQNSLNPTQLGKVLRFANACGALTTQKAGAIPALPTRDEVCQFMGHHS